MRGRTGQTQGFPLKMATFEHFREESNIDNYGKIILKIIQQSAVRFVKSPSYGSMLLFSLKSRNIIDLVG